MLLAKPSTCWAHFTGQPSLTFVSRAVARYSAPRQCRIWPWPRRADWITPTAHPDLFGQGRRPKVSSSPVARTTPVTNKTSRCSGVRRVDSAVRSFRSNLLQMVCQDHSERRKSERRSQQNTWVIFLEGDLKKDADNEMELNLDLRLFGFKRPMFLKI